MSAGVSFWVPACLMVYIYIRYYTVYKVYSVVSAGVSFWVPAFLMVYIYIRYYTAYTKCTA